MDDPGARFELEEEKEERRVVVVEDCEEEELFDSPSLSLVSRDSPLSSERPRRRATQLNKEDVEALVSSLLLPLLPSPLKDKRFLSTAFKLGEE
tara:strand:- start:353 stop:634 length:282 start_codon:yes stop_codon:yes gene_type:complete